MFSQAITRPERQAKDRLQDIETLTLTNDQFAPLWQDDWGSGRLRLRFDQKAKSFLGIWTFKEKIESTWTGNRIHI